MIPPESAGSGGPVQSLPPVSDGYQATFNLSCTVRMLSADYNNTVLFSLNKGLLD